MKMLAIASVIENQKIKYLESSPVPFRKDVTAEDATKLLFPSGVSNIEFFEKPRWTIEFLLIDGFGKVIGSNNPKTKLVRSSVKAGAFDLLDTQKC